MTKEQAREAMQRYCEAEDARVKAEHETRAECARANGLRLGTLTIDADGKEVHSLPRPKKFKRRPPPWPLTEFRNKVLGVRSTTKWEGCTGPNPCLTISILTMLNRHHCHRWNISLMGEDLTKDTSWLEGTDVDHVGLDRVRFRTGLEIVAQDGQGMPWGFKRLTEAEISSDAVLLEVAEQMERTFSGGTPPSNGVTPTKRSAQSPFSDTVHKYVVGKWAEFKKRRKGGLRATYRKFINHPDYNQQLTKHGVTEPMHVERIIQLDQKRRLAGKKTG